jgi:hypothetical protein
VDRGENTSGRFMRLTKCKICRELYTKWSISQKTCSNPSCAIELMQREKAKKARKVQAADKVKIRTRREWVSLAQVAFNAYIRERDKDLPCICCGQWPKVMGKYGGDFDAGHFLTVGAYPELRFTENNCHKQSKSCNAGSGKFSHKLKTVSEGYRERLIEKIGKDAVESLEGPHEPAKWTVEDLQGIIKKYRVKLKELKGGNSAN